MLTPQRIPGRKLFMILLAIYAAVWIALEGNLVQVTILGCAVTVAAIGALYERWIAARSLSLAAWLALCAALGTLAGFSSAISTLLFMAVKTGLHAHGPEFTQAEIAWVLAQAPWWTSAGLLAGVGLGLLVAVSKR